MANGAVLKDARLVRRENEDKLGNDIIDECRVQLMLKFRFLDLALWRMSLKPVRIGMAYPLATDARCVYYDPPRTIARFQESFEESVRDYLHAVMHCVFRHPFNDDYPNLEAWNLTCDIIVENAIMEMCATRFVCADDPARKTAVDEIRMHVGTLLPGKVYKLLTNIVIAPEGKDFLGMDRAKLNEWHALFERCDHSVWPANNKSDKQVEGEDDQAEGFDENDEEPDVQSDGIQQQSPDDPAPESGGDDEAQMMDENGSSDSEGEEEEEDEAAEEEGEGSGESRGRQSADPEEDFEREKREWEDLAKEIEMNLETFSKEWGEEASSLMANLSLANRKQYSYTDFLRQFMVINEEMKLNMDEFDYIYYTFGMDLYGNMPFIEPLEYKEIEAVRDFAIVIDTSQSVSGELVKKFIGHTFDILKTSQDFAHEVNVHIIQCDSKVQSDMKIRRLRDVDKVIENFVIRGFGSTDFRPAFDYVEQLRKRGDLENIKGLIYFTDGLGQFPESAPDYDAAFVFMDEEGRALPPVPPWACKIVIDENGINRLKS